MTMLTVNCHEIRKVRVALTLTQCVLLHQRLGLWGGGCIYFRFRVQYFVFKFLHCFVRIVSSGTTRSLGLQLCLHRS